MLDWVNSSLWVPFKIAQWFSHYSLLSCKKQSWFSWHNPPIRCSELTQWRECSVHQELTTPFVTPISLDAHTTCGTRMSACVCVRVLYLFTCDPHNENVFNHCPLQSFASGTSTLPFPVVQLNGRCVRFHSRSPTETTPSPSIHLSPLHPNEIACRNGIWSISYSSFFLCFSFLFLVFFYFLSFHLTFVHFIYSFSCCAVFV